MICSSGPIISGSPGCFGAIAPEKSVQGIAENFTTFVSLIVALRDALITATLMKFFMREDVE